MFRKLVTKRIFPTLSIVKESLPVEDGELTSNFTDSEPSFDVICIVSILLIKYDVTSKITEDGEDFDEEMVVQKPFVTMS